jgi:transcriptional regulator with XRE-family HTH domain
MARDRGLAVEIGMHLREARLDSGLTQAQAAARTGYKQGQISFWEAGRYLISIDVLLEFADLYDVCPLVLLGRERWRGTIIDGTDISLTRETA